VKTVDNLAEETPTGGTRVRKFFEKRIYPSTDIPKRDLILGMQREKKFGKTPSSWVINLGGGSESLTS